MSNLEDLLKRRSDFSPERRALLEKWIRGDFAARGIARRAQDGPAPLSFAQQRLWFLDQLVPGAAAYNMPSPVRIRGSLDITTLERSLDEIARRHDTLRTTFATADDQPVQVIAAPQPGARLLALPLFDLQAFPELEREVEVQRLASEDARQPFNLARGPLVRARLLRLDPQDHVLLLTMHHIITDGWSMQVFIHEVIALYAAFAAGQPSSLPALPIQYADYAVWQRDWLRDEVLRSQLSYWRAQLNTGLALLELPTDRPRPAVQSFRGAMRSFMLPRDLCAAITALCQREDVTLFMALLAAFQALIARSSGQDDINVGSPIAGRTRAETEGLIGFFANTLVLRGDLSGNPTVRALLARVREVCLGAYAHQDLPFEMLVEELQPERDMSRNPLFQVMFVLQNTPPAALELPGLTFSSVKYDSGSAKFDLWLSMSEGAELLGGALEYNTDLFDATTIDRMLGHFERLLCGMVADPAQHLADLPLLTEAEQQQILGDWNTTGRDYPLERCLHELVEAQVARTPDAIALVFDGTKDEGRRAKEELSGFVLHPSSSVVQLTYAELNRRANQLAQHLRTLGVGPDVPVAVCLPRSLELTVALLGVLKAGGAYVPLDPSYPPDRLTFMIEDAEVGVLVTDHSRDDGRWTMDDLAEAQPSIVNHTSTSIYDLRLTIYDLNASQIPIVNHQSKIVHPDNLAYVIYTSGSTGTPKGVMNVHRAIVNRLLWMQDTYQLGADDCVLQKTPFSFDVSVWEFFWPLIAGARLVVARPDGHKDPAYMVGLIARSRITTLHFVPSMLRLFLEEPDLSPCGSLRRVICSGETLPLAVQERFFARLGTELHNLYGPTEAAVDVTSWACERTSARRTVPIGQPIANTQIYLLDRYLQPVPIGTPGELYIGGVQLARGYLGRPNLTAERFVPNPFLATKDERRRTNDEAEARPGVHRPSSFVRLYKTGDLARYQPDGSIEYLGRIDHQVKLRGFRIELGEIEATLRRHPAIADAIALVREDRAAASDYPDKRLVAYLVPRTATADQPAHVPGAPTPAEQVAQWQQIFDETYRESDPRQDPAFNIAGWNSSYTGQPIPAAEMREWVERTVERIRALRPRRVLEIGCGSGLLLFRLAPDCIHYCGADVSPEALAYLRQQLAEAGRALPQATLLERPADDFDAIAPASFDTVILNSVVQYFPDVEYLVHVLEGAVQAVAPGGHVFVGDVRSLPLLETFHASVELYRAPDDRPAAQVQQRARWHMAQEEELVIDPAFFHALGRQLPRISHVAVLLKRGHHHNELTSFRYDVVIQVEAPGPSTSDIPTLDWRQDRLSLDALRQRLPAEQPAALRIVGVPNARLREAVRAQELLASADHPASAGELRAAVQSAAEGGVDPEDIWALGDELSYTIELTWTGVAAPDRFDALFRRADAAVPKELAAPAAAASVERQPWSVYANNPLREKLARALVPALRGYLKEKLPEYMVPSAFVLLDALPLTLNGKIDRDALPVPIQPLPELEGDFVAPRTPVEHLLADIWAQVLIVERIGVTSNFFEFGGDSIQSIQIVARANQAGLRLTLKDLFRHQTIAELAAVVEASPAAPPEPAPAAEPVALPQLDQPTRDRLFGAGQAIETLYPLSPMQAHMLSCYLSNPQPGLYVIQRIIARQDQLNISVFERAWQRVVERHQFLRTSIIWQGLERPLQAVHQQMRVRIGQADWRGLSPAEQELRMAAFIAADRRRGFDLDDPLTNRLFVARVSEERYQIVLTSHYMRLDGWSFNLITSDLFAFYAAFAQDQDLQREPPHPYTDYIAWIERQDASAEETFWRGLLAGVPAPTPLVERMGGEPEPSQEFARQHIYLPASTSAGLQTLAQQQRLTLSTLLQGAWALLLSHYSDEQEVIFGYMVSGRPATLPGVERIVGPFANVLPMRVDIAREAALLPWLKKLKARQIEISQHEHTSLRKIHAWSDVPADLPLFQSYVAFQNLPRFDAAGRLIQRSTSPEVVESYWAQMEHPLRIDVFPGSPIGLVMSYYRRYFVDAAITRMLTDLELVLTRMAGDPAQRLGDLLRLLPPRLRLP
jgi:amino acid adenylation domain-containing protein